MQLSVVSGCASEVRTLHRLVVLKKVLSLMPGGTGSSTVLCDDGRSYVVKKRANPQGPNVLANELVGTELMSVLGLPTPNWRFATTSCAGLSPRNSDAQNCERSSCELHFASELVSGLSTETISNHLSESAILRLSNRADFIGALVFDVWAGSIDARQAVYVRGAGATSYRAVFIDHGHLFGGPYWLISNSRGRALTKNRFVYDGLFDSNLINDWVALLQSKIPSVLPAILETVPAQWFTGDIFWLKEVLLDRLSVLKSAMEEEIDHIRNDASGFVGAYHRKLACPPLGHRGNQAIETQMAGSQGVFKFHEAG